MRTEVSGQAVLTLEGDIDMATYRGWQERGARRLAGTPDDRLTVDFGNVSFIDSCGLAVLTWLRNLVVARGGVISVRNVPHNIARVMAVAGMKPLFPVVS